MDEMRRFLVSAKGGILDSAGTGQKKQATKAVLDDKTITLKL